MDIIALIGLSIIILYIFNEFLKYNDLDPTEFSIVYIVFTLFVCLALFLPNGMKNALFK